MPAGGGDSFVSQADCIYIGGHDRARASRRRVGHAHGERLGELYSGGPGLASSDRRQRPRCERSVHPRRDSRPDASPHAETNSAAHSGANSGTQPRPDTASTTTRARTDASANAGTNANPATSAGQSRPRPY